MSAISEKDWAAITKKLADAGEYSSFVFEDAEREYIRSRGMEIITRHTKDFVSKNIEPAEPRNDGRQTPIKGHPVFIAQHATATCCRGCLEKIHGLKKGQKLTDEQVEYVVNVILRWIEEQVG